ncbi:MAG: hypothetical protein V3U16_05770 [Candidatus Neomarinimicrobiota bacterium]
MKKQPKYKQGDEVYWWANNDSSNITIVFDSGFDTYYYWVDFHNDGGGWYEEDQISLKPFKETPLENKIAI